MAVISSVISNPTNQPTKKANAMKVERKSGPYGMDKLSFESCGLALYRNRNGLFDTCGHSVTIRDVAEMLRAYGQPTNQPTNQPTKVKR